VCEFEDDACAKQAGAPFADVAQLVEHDVANVEVAGSSPVIRSNLNIPWPLFVDLWFWYIRHSQAPVAQMDRAEVS
jgi:hypothetical protein